MENEAIEAHELKEKAVEERKGFRIHRRVYSVVVPALAVINFQTVPHSPWFLFPLFGWGLGLTMHYLLAVRLPEKELAKNGVEL